MSLKEEKILVKIICPHCQLNFKKNVEYHKKDGLSSILIKKHPEGENCSPFIAFIDSNGRHRGSQKIDNIEEEDSINEQILENTRRNIEVLEKALRFYHIKAPRKGGRAFEHKMANVKDRAFMSSKFYSRLIEFLTENEDDNIFGISYINEDGHFEGGLLLHGKYLGMIYTIFWKDQKLLLNKTIEELKINTNLMVEKLFDTYDLSDFFN